MKTRRISDMTELWDYAANLERVVAEHRRALLALGDEKQFPGEVCFCKTAANLYCVGQPQCRAAQSALAAS